MTDLVVFTNGIKDASYVGMLKILFAGFALIGSPFALAQQTSTGEIIDHLAARAYGRQGTLSHSPNLDRFRHVFAWQSQWATQPVDAGFFATRQVRGSAQDVQYPRWGDMNLPVEVRADADDLPIYRQPLLRGFYSGDARDVFVTSLLDGDAFLVLTTDGQEVMDPDHDVRRTGDVIVVLAEPISTDAVTAWSQLPGAGMAAEPLRAAGAAGLVDNRVASRVQSLIESTKSKLHLITRDADNDVFAVKSYGLARDVTGRHYLLHTFQVSAADIRLDDFKLFVNELEKAIRPQQTGCAATITGQLKGP